MLALNFEQQGPAGALVEGLTITEEGAVAGVVVVTVGDEPVAGVVQVVVGVDV